MSAFPAAALIQAGGDIVSKLLEKKPKVYSPGDQIRSSVKAARDLGIHPLAALGAGAGYSVVGSSPSAGSAVGSAVSKIGQQMAMAKSEEEINALRADTAARNAQADLYRAQSRTLLARTASSAIGGPSVKANPQAKPITVGGVTFTRDPSKFSSAQDASDEYGDIIENVVGIPAFAEAGVRNINRWLDANAPFLRTLENYRFNKGRYNR